MLSLYKSLIRPVLTYGCAILLQADEHVWKRLEITENKAIRAALGLPHYTSTTYIRTLSKIPKIRTYAISLAERILTRAQLHQDIISETNLQNILTNL